VTFASGVRREFDLIVGADGLHSGVREIVFGPESQFERFLGFKAAALRISGYRPRDELTYVMYTEVGQQVTRFAMRADRTMFPFTFIDSNPDTGDQRDRKAMRGDVSMRADGNAQILKTMDRADELYFDG
jgi:2-polyprenyl-6-methoxyphenol hydroxylase-like FAD-dependent oxidoreductase